MNELEHDTTDLDAVRHELEQLRAHAARADGELAAARPLITAARALTVWDYTPYGVSPGRDWVAVDRASIAHLLAALAGVDHWTPWSTRLEPRPQP